MTELTFASATRDLEDLLQIEPLNDALTIDLFEDEISSGIVGERVEIGTSRATGLIETDYDLNLVIGGVSLGDLRIEYPVEVELNTPDEVEPGDAFIVDLANGTGDVDEFVALNAALQGRGFGVQDLALDLAVRVSDASLTDVSVFSQDLGAFVELGDFILADVAASLRIVEIENGVNDLGASENFLVTVGNLEGDLKREQPETIGEVGELPAVEQVRRDELFDARIAIVDILDDIPFLVRNPEFLSFQGLSQNFLEDLIFINTEVQVILGIDLVDLLIQAGVEIVQTTRFEPTDIEATVTIEGQTDAETVQVGSIRDELEFIAPNADSEALADGQVNGVASYDLKGDLITTIALERTGIVNFSALSADARVSFDGGASFTNERINRLFEELISPDPAVVFILNEVRSKLPDDVFAPIDIDFTIDVAEIGPIMVENLPAELLFDPNTPTPINFIDILLFDPDTDTPVAVTVSVDKGLIIRNDAFVEGVAFQGLGTNQVVLVGLIEDIEDIFLFDELSFDGAGVEGTATLTLTGDDRDGFADTQLGQVVLTPEPDPLPGGVERSGGAGNDALDADDLDGDGEEDDNAGETPVVFRGGPGDDTLAGSREGDILLGEDGDDLVQGRSGADELFGGGDDDRLFGGADQDDLFGGLGDDTLTADDGNDRLDGGPGENELFGGDGSDTLVASGERDQLFGGDDADRVTGGALRDSLFGDGGDDVITGGGGDDDIFTGTGDDTAFGGTGNDDIITQGGSQILFGDAGDDDIDITSTADDRPEVFGGDGDDTVEGGAGAEDVYGGLDNDNINGGAGADTLRGEGGNDTLDAGRDDDGNTLLGGDGDDILRGGDDSLDDIGGSDILDGGAGDDTIFVRDGSARDQVFGGDGADRIFVSTTTASVDAGAGDDTITVSEDPDPGVDALLQEISGGDGNDSIDAFAVARLEASDQIGVFLDGGQGNDTLIGTPFADSIFDLEGDNLVRSLGAGEGDLVETGGGVDDISLGGGDDTINAGGGSDVIRGGGGADEIDGEGGADTIFISHSLTEQGERSSSVDGGAGNDTLFGPDLVRGDTLNGGAGDDDFRDISFGLTLEGESGVDQLIFGDALSSETFSVTVDLAGGKIIDNSDVLGSGDDIAIANIEIVELVNRVVSEQDVEPLIGQRAELDRALELLKPGETEVPGPLDVVLGGAADEILANAAGRAVLSGGAGDDFLIALLSTEGSGTGAGRETFLDGGEGDDSLVGGAFDDTVIADLNDTQADGRGGVDLINFDNLSDEEELFVDLSNIVDQVAFLNNAPIAIANFENIIGRDGGDDELFGGADTRSISGLDGDDLIGATDLTEDVTLNGGDGFDAFRVTEDRATAVFLEQLEDPNDPGNFALVGTASLLDFADADDEGAFLFSIEIVFGGEGDDFFDADSGDVSFFGDGGDDLLQSGDGADLLVGGQGADEIASGDGDDELEGGGGDDQLTGGLGADLFIFQTDFGDDVITDFLFGVDTLEFAANAPEDVQFSQVADGVLVEVAERGGTVLLLGASILDPIGDNVVLKPLAGGAPPIARDDAFTTVESAAIGGRLFDDNGEGEDFDPDGDAFTVASVNGLGASIGQTITLASGALATVAANGAFEYDPNGAFDALFQGQTAEDSFDYTIADNEGESDQAIVTFTITGAGQDPDDIPPAVIPPAVGGDGDDLFQGGAAADNLSGGAGNDTLIGGGGGDTLIGGAGADSLVGNGGRDDLSGGRGGDSLNGNGGADNLAGNGGRDLLSGGSGRDTLNGGGGRDTVEGGGGRDRLSGGGGRDSLDGGGGRDTIEGSGGADILQGGGGADMLSGGNGRDEIDGGRGTDVLTGGAGADRFVFEQFGGRNVITDFEQGRDRIAFDNGPDEFGALQITQVEQDVLIAFANIRIVIEDDQVGNFAANDFIF